MKKAIAIILCALMLFVPVLTVSAADAGGIKANELADAGQQTLYVGGKAQTAPKVDGTVEAGEYSHNFTFRNGDPGV